MAGYIDYLLRNKRRKKRMAQLRARGWTLERIGQYYGVSRQRVGHILKAGQ